VSDARSSERKALLATRAELDRTRVTLALHGIRTIVAPVSDAGRLAGARPLAATFVRFAGPFVGAARLGRWLRVASIALFALRIVRGWK
jgi:hypothetical protein